MFTRILCFLMVEVLMLFWIVVALSAWAIPLLLIVQILERVIP